MKTTRNMLTVVMMIAAIGVLAVTAQAATIGVNDPLVTSLGLSEGDIFHLAFVTSTTRDATDTGIGAYNTFVNDVANATGSTVKDYGWTWKAIAQTVDNPDARVNTGTVYSAENPGNPIYLGGPTYSLVASGNKKLWTQLSHAIDSTEKGETVAGTTTVWTGNMWNRGGGRLGGTPDSCYAKVSTMVSYGGQWAYFWYAASTVKKPILAMSEAVQIVPEPEPSDIPEPATMAMVSLAACGLSGYVRRRKGF